jgi:cytochrome P450/glutathione S-transferase
MVEMARWFFELNGIPYAEEAHVPILHVIATRRAHGGNEIPVVVTAEDVWGGARAFLSGLDAKTPPDRRLLGNTETERNKNIGHIDHLLSLLLLQVRRYVYFHLLPHRRVLYPVVTQGAPLWERLFVALLYPAWRWLMGKGLNLSPNLVESASSDIEEAFSYVEGLLADRGRFIAGDLPGVVDIVFAALVSPLILPCKFGAQLPKFEELPEALRKMTVTCRQRPAGLLAFETYELCRPKPQEHLRPCSRAVTLRSVFFGPGTQLQLSKILRRLAPRLILGRIAVFSNWKDVRELLSRDLEFLIAPINGAKIDAISGPFVLGLDRCEKLVRERSQMYAALAAVDLSKVREQGENEARRLLTGAKAASGKIDVVNGYARLVATRTAVLLFGVRGPTEAELMRVARIAFHYIFLNLGSKGGELKAQAIAGARELKEWINSEIKERTKAGHAGDGILGALLARRPIDADALDDDGVARTVSGLLIGAIDTTATAVGQITSVLLNDRNFLLGVQRDIDNPDRVLGWCWEALRRWPHNPLLLRHASAGTALAGKTFTKDMTIVGLTLAAMNDPAAFPRPNQLDPSRPRDRYLHFGGGLHPCAGRAVNGVQVPLLVRELVKAGGMRVARPRFDGPFIDELVVTL